MYVHRYAKITRESQSSQIHVTLNQELACLLPQAKSHAYINMCVYMYK